ncbi:MAG TPA: hypothetical protein VEC57_20000 [Candidatus Limnocylindrales bacterium]|nr:hypothetical protein [Candidatus Limnocylindrales bacterium]
MAASAGISLRTLNRFLKVAEKAVKKRESGHRLTHEEQEFCQFCLDFHKAEFTVERARRGCAEGSEVELAGGLGLERRYRKLWGRRRIVEQVRAPKPRKAPPPAFRPDAVTLS